jgi:hypothetical protein
MNRCRPPPVCPDSRQPKDKPMNTDDLRRCVVPVVVVRASRSDRSLHSYFNAVHSWSCDRLKPGHAIRDEFSPIEREPLNFLEMARMVGGLIQPLLDHVLQPLVPVELPPCTFAEMVLSTCTECGPSAACSMYGLNQAAVSRGPATFHNVSFGEWRQSPGLHLWGSLPMSARRPLSGANLTLSGHRRRAESDP